MPLSPRPCGPPPSAQRAPAPTRRAFQPYQGAALVCPSGSAGRYAEAVLRRLALAREGERHNALLSAAARLMSLARAGQLDPRAAGARLIAVALSRGLERPEIDSILDWAWQTVAPEELPR